MATKTNYTSNGKEYYRIRRTIDGVQKAFYGSSKGDAERQYKEYLESLAKGEEEYDGATFHARAKEYIEGTLKVSQKYAKGTINAYVGQYDRHIRDTWLDKTRIKDIRPSTIQKFYNELDVSQHAIKNLNKFMSAFNKWLVLNGYAPDFLSAVEIPKKEDTSRHEIIVWTDDEVASILTAVRLSPAHRQAFLIQLLLYTGVRISEALSLKYSDIDDVIRIERQWYLGEIKEPKWGSKRTIPMHPELKKAYAIHKEWHRQDMIKNNYNTDYVFTTSTGQLYHQASVRKALERFYKKNNIPYKHIHAYRATFCTQMCRCGVSLEVTSKLMGHKSLEVTAAHYALVKEDTQTEAIYRLTYEI